MYLNIWNGTKMRFDCSTPPAPHIKGLRKKCTNVIIKSTLDFLFDLFI